MKWHRLKYLLHQYIYLIDKAVIVKLALAQLLIRRVYSGTVHAITHEPYYSIKV